MKNQPKSSDLSTLFSVTIVLRPHESDDGVIYNRKVSITSGIHDYIRKNAIEGVLIQSVEGKCLTLSSAIRFGTSRVRHDLQKHLRDRHVLKFFEDRPNAIQVMCTVTSAREDERHAIYETLRRMVRRLPTAASQGEAGQQRLLATSPLVLDIKNGWASLEYDRGLALESVPVTCEEDIPHSALSADGTKAYLVSNDARLTNGRCEVLSDCSGDGSDDQSSDGSDSDVGAARDAGMRFEHLPEFPDSDSDDGAWDGSIIGSDAGSESSASDCNSVEGGGGSCAANSAGARRSSRATVRTPAGPGFELLHAGHGNGPGEASYSPTVSTASEVRSTAVQQQQSDPAVGSTDCSAVGSTAVQQQALQVHPTSSGSTKRPQKTGAHNVRAQQSDSAMRLVKTNVPAKRAGKQSKPKESAKKKKTPKLTRGQKIIAGMVPLFRSSV